MWILWLLASLSPEEQGCEALCQWVWADFSWHTFNNGPSDIRVFFSQTQGSHFQEVFKMQNFISIKMFLMPQFCLHFHVICTQYTLYKTAYFFLGNLINTRDFRFGMLQNLPINMTELINISIWTVLFVLLQRPVLIRTFLFNFLAEHIFQVATETTTIWFPSQTHNLDLTSRNRYLHWWYDLTGNLSNEAFNHLSLHFTRCAKKDLVGFQVCFSFYLHYLCCVFSSM